jgi:hypothetical protein
VAESFHEGRLEQEPLTVEKVQANFLERLASLKYDIITHDGPYDKEVEYTAPDGFGHIIRLSDGRPVISSTFGPNEPIKHTDNYPFVMSSLSATIRSVDDVDLHLHGSNKRYLNLRAAYYPKEGADILDLIEVETIPDRGDPIPEPWE